MYQAAVSNSKRADNTIPSRVMEESEVCSLPGGLASVRKQFEIQETATSHNVTQYHFHHRTVQETSNSEVTVSSGSRQVVLGSQQQNFNQGTMMSYSDNNLESSYENYENETEEEVPRYTTKELRDHFERTIEEAAPHKPIKIERDINRSKWSSNKTQNNTVTSEMYEASATEAAEDISATVMDYEDFPPPPAEDSDYLPPPPPDLLQMPSDCQDIPVCRYSPESPEPAKSTKPPTNKEAYFKQRSMNELKRLYKHIHPEVRKNIEKEFYSDFSETENNQLESEEYMYEDDGDDITDEEYVEWEEILPGEVQAMRWMFENKPLDTIKNETHDEDDENELSQQEMILGKDVKRTAWMFETKPMDELSSNNISSTEYKNKFNKFDKGDVRAAAWLFETHTMDSLNKMHKEEDLTKEIVFTEEDGHATIYMIDNKCMDSLGHTETIDESHLLSLRSVLEEINGEVKTVTSTFDTQFKCVIMGQSSQMLEIKSVRKIETELENSIASRWLFDTQPLDMTENREPPSLKLVCSLSMEDNNKGDWGRWLFEIKTLNSLKEWESSKMENKEITGADVRKHCLVFETQPMDSLKDDSNARPQSIEEIIGGNVRSARHFFESSPQAERKTGPEVGKLQNARMNEEMKGDVRHQKWRFESQPLEHIREEKKEVTRTVNVEDDLTQEDGTSCRADVRKNCWVFETQPMDTLKDDSDTLPLTKEDIIAGNVRSARHYFETFPTEDLKELAEVGKLKKAVALNEERGDVRHQKWRFESQPLEQIRQEKKEIIRTIDLEEIDKVDVSNYKQIFETTDLNRRDESQKILIEGVTSGSVKSNKSLFELTPLYAMQDSSGHFHEVKTVRREEVVKGDVTTCKWMFETRPIDQFDESIDKYKIIKGISKQEIESGDVKTAKWLFETQPLDAIKYFSNIEDEEVVDTSKNLDVMKGDVKTCKWLFETKPMDILYERVEVNSENETDEMQKGDVKTCTWLFETQALDTIHDETETILKTCTVNQEDVRGKDVRMACFLFETEKLENLTGEETGSFKRVTEIDISSGDVSRMKYIFENQTSDIMTSTSEDVMQKLKRVQTQDIQKGNVVNCKWLFENHSIDTIHDSQEESMSSRTVNDVQGGDVDKSRFIFETCSLDKIHDVSSETDTEMMKMQKIVRDEDEKGDVRNYTMMFENQPLYAIQDKEGLYHEVTTVTSEEVTRGDVVGTRWLFETKPLDAIKDTDEVYIIKSVTQQDVQKGDVTSAKWKFETQPLDRIAEENKSLTKTVNDIQGGNVRMNKNRFESDALSEDSVRTVNVSEIQKGDVRTAKWRFETQSIDKIRSMSSENLIETVKKEEVAKGDVKQSVWLFEKNPLDHIKEVDEDVDHSNITQEEISKADVKTTTWLFETTPFDNFNETKMEKTEILGKSIKGTLEELYSQEMVKSKGILIEADEIGDVRMAKYQLMNKQAPEIQREEVIRGDLQTIMMNLLNRQDRQEQQIVIDSEEKGNISSTVQQLFNQEKDSCVEREEIIRGDIQEAINNLFDQARLAKHGILIQEDEKGDVQMTLYSLLNKQKNVNVEKEDIVRGDIKSALQRLSKDKSDQAEKIKVDDTEKGNVSFYSTCIESGALDYLKQLHLGPDEPDTAEKEKIVGGDIKGTKLILGRNQTQIERTVEDIVPGDVHNTVKVFMSEPVSTLEKVQKEEIVKGDLRAALNSLSESANHTAVKEKEEVVKGNIPKALRCLERAQKRYKEVEKPDIIPGNIKGALRSLEKSATTRVEAVVEDLVTGDVRATLKSLELAKQAVREVEKEEIVRGDIRIAMQSLQDASSEKRKCPQGTDVQGDVRGAIQLLMEPPPSPTMQRSPILEDDIKGDVKMSIKSLYETQEQTQLEKEEVIKGDVKGTIKSLLETAQRQTPKVKLGAYRRVKVKQSPPVKNLNADAHRSIQKIKTANSVETSKENHSVSNGTEVVRTKLTSVEQSAQQSTAVMEHKTITQNHGIKTLKTEFRNLKPNQSGMIKADKTKVKTGVYILKPQAPEPDLPLPPPPPPVLDADLPPPPPPVDSDIDHLPPPPPPLTSEQDFLPPPPSQQELESMPAQANYPSPAKAKKMTVKKVKAPTLHPVPKLEPKMELCKTEQVEVTSGKVVEMSQNQSKTTTTHTSKTVSCEIPPLAESPQPFKKVCISPVKFTPPPSPPPFMRTSKFNTPLMKAEEKYRKTREENTPPTTPTPTHIHDSVSAALEMLSTKDTEQSNKNTSEISQERAKKMALNVHSDRQSCDLSSHVVVSNTTQSNVSTSHGKILTDSTIISSAAQQMVSNETSKVVSVQKTSSVSAVRQQMHTTTQKTVSVSSKQSDQSVMVDKFQTSITGAAKTENMMVETQKDSKNKKTKGSIKSEGKKEDKMHSDKVKPEPVTTEERVKSSKSQSEDKKTKDNAAPEISNILCNQSCKIENITSYKNVKESKSPQRDNKKKTDQSPTKSQDKVSNQEMQTEKAAANTNGKTGKPNQKGKKNNKQEKQVETKNESEKSIAQDVAAEVKEVTEVKVISESKEGKTELKQGIKKVTTSSDAASAPAVTVCITESQPETPTPAKKKKKSKKSKGAAGQGKDINTESKTDVIETKTAISEKSHQTKETIAVAQIHQSIKEEHFQVKREVITAESKDDQNSQQQKAVQKHVKASQKKKGVTVTQQSAEKPPEERGDVPITVTGESEQNELEKSTTGRTEESQRQEVQVLISHITETQRVSEKTDYKSAKALLETATDWLMSPERKCEMEESIVESHAHRNDDIFSHVRGLAEPKLMHLEDNETMEKHECEPVSEKSVSGGATPRISKISIGSAKIENQTKRKTSHERRKEEVNLCKSVDLRAPSPLLRMRSPSPTFITIESTRRTDSPQRVTPSPTLLHRPPTPPTPPPRRCDTPTSRLTRITPSPTFDRAENLARLKDTTAKLSRGVTPPPVPQQISEKKSEIVESPASFHRQIKIESQLLEASGISIATEKPKKSLSGGAQWADINSARIEEDKANISEGLNANEAQRKSETHVPLCQNDPDLVEASDISEPSSASVKEKRDFFEEAQKAEINKTYMRKEPIAIPERLGPDMEECEAEKKNKEMDELPRTDLSSLVNKFESTEGKLYIRKELIPLSEQLHSDAESTDCDKEKADILQQEKPTFDIQAIKNVFELGEQSSIFREEKKDQEEPVSSLSETAADTSKRESPQETKAGSRQSTPLPLQRNEAETVSAEPPAYTETKSITEHFSDVDEFGNKVTGTRTAITEHSESVSTQQAPFSYADAVKRKAAAVKQTETYDEEATERLLRNFHKTWTESETVFKSLGYTVSEETTSQIVSHQTKIVSSGSSSEVGALHSMSEESLSDGCSDSGQKKVP
ncbi:xin actin-binding repeat-containing protein 2 [Pempheris klunzingeri]|uniref:xin actin-binding repeat-containing protein 2 n=1 Tax=Pempheris klunzingeri TaxID=3127111 RepID=UPI00397EDB56